jgi:hypothetical protein
MGDASPSRPGVGRADPAHLQRDTASVLRPEKPVEKARAGLLLVAGGEDAIWPSLPFAEHLAQRRRSSDAPVRLIARHDAGHRPRLPGESPASASPHFQY